MAWIRASDRVPPEGEEIGIYDGRHDRIEFGRYVRGRWYVEDLRDGRLREIAGVTHWCWILDSEVNDESDDD